jgi:hypothetical protein
MIVGKFTGKSSGAITVYPDVLAKYCFDTLGKGEKHGSESGFFV